MNKLGFKDILSTKQLSKENLKIIFDTAKEMEKRLSGEKESENILK
jgi:aspartate carbamoyltransferase catalytic subunit